MVHIQPVAQIHWWDTWMGSEPTPPNYYELELFFKGPDKIPHTALREIRNVIRRTVIYAHISCINQGITAVCGKMHIKDYG